MERKLSLVERYTSRILNSSRYATSDTGFEAGNYTEIQGQPNSRKIKFLKYQDPHFLMHSVKSKDPSEKSVCDAKEISVRFQNDGPVAACNVLAGKTNFYSESRGKTLSDQTNTTTNSSLGKSTILEISCGKATFEKSDHFTERSRCFRAWEEKTYELPYTALKHTRPPPDFTMSYEVTTTPTGANDAILSLLHQSIVSMKQHPGSELMNLLHKWVQISKLFFKFVCQNQKITEICL